MMTMSVSLRFRSSVIFGNRGSVYIQFIKNREVKTVTTPYRVYPEEWNATLSSIRLGATTPKREHELREISLALSKELAHLQNLVFQEEARGGCSLEEAVSFYCNKDSSLLFSDFVEELVSKMTLPHQSRLSRAYRTVSNNLKTFNSGKEVPLIAINSRFIEEYETYMKGKNNLPNTISFYMRNTRSIFNKAIKLKVIAAPSENPFSGVYTGIAKTRKRAVKQEVIDGLMKLDLLEGDKVFRGTKSINANKAGKINPLAFSRDLFLFSFLLRGISFIDLAYLKKTDLCGNLITYTRHKTGQQLEVFVTPSIREIISRYSRYCKDTDYLLPVLPSEPEPTRKHYENAIRRQNRYLKILSSLMKLDVPLTTYVSRHSWASIALAKGIPVSIISHGLGHYSERTTQIYLDSFDYSLVHKANRIITDFSKKAS
jgi:integrase